MSSRGKIIECNYRVYYTVVQCNFTSTERNDIQHTLHAFLIVDNRNCNLQASPRRCQFVVSSAYTVDCYYIYRQRDNKLLMAVVRLLNVKAVKYEIRRVDGVDRNRERKW